MNVKFVQASKAYAPHVGGIETVVRQLAEGLASRGHQSRVIVCGNGEMPPDGPVEVSRSHSFGTFRSIPLAPSYGLDLLRSEGDVLLIHMPSALPEIVAQLGWRRLRKRYGRILVWWHSDILRQKMLAKVYSPIVRDLLHNVDGIIVATPKHITSSAVLPEFAHKTQVIPYGVDLDRFAGRSPTPEGFFHDPSRRTAIFVGRLVYYKGVDELLAAFKRVSGCRLVVVGDGPLLSQVEAARAESNSDVVRFAPLPDAEMIGLIQSSDFFVFPSVETSEAFGISQVEAMACGKPVITFDLPSGVTWVNRHLETGLVVGLHDTEALARAMQRFVDDAALVEELGANAQARVHRELSESVMLDRVEALVRGGELHVAAH